MILVSLDSNQERVNLYILTLGPQYLELKFPEFYCIYHSKTPFSFFCAYISSKRGFDLLPLINAFILLADTLQIYSITNNSA